MLVNKCLLVFAIFNSVALLRAEEPHVHLPVGSLVGRQRSTATGVTYYSYQGIPFAEPPVGARRFQASVEKRPWKNVLDATKEGSPCYQMYAETPIESEDCLFINVYTPVKPPTNKSLPVMFWVYGGGFLNGMATELQFGADHLVSKDIVVVEANYRIGPFGFFSTGDDVIPGNAGLKDQALALRWTNKYIKYFGGDANKVTIFGQSAGSASVSYHLLSPLSKGLFHAAILESGSALSPWAYNRNQTKFSHDLAKIIDAEEYARHSSSSRALMNYLQSLPADKIDSASLKLFYPKYNQIQHGFYFAPVIEVEHPGAFITKRQYELFESGSINNVPVMLGYNSEEEIGLLTDQYRDTTLNDLDSDETILIPLDMNEKARGEVAQLIHKHYNPSGTYQQNPRNAVKYLSDQSFVRSIHKQAQLQSKYGNIWLYKFSYKGTMSGGSNVPVQGFSPDVGHGEELFYVFAFKYSGRNTTDASVYPKEDIAVHNRMVTLWSNFAKFHNPTPIEDGVLQNIIWPLFKTPTEQYLHIGSELEVNHHPNQESMAFWDDLYNKYGTPPYDSY